MLALITLSCLALLSVVALSVVLLTDPIRGGNQATPVPSTTPVPSAPPGGDEHRTPQQDREQVPYPDPPTSTTAALDLAQHNTIYDGEVGAGAECAGLPDPKTHPSGDAEELRRTLLAEMDCSHALWGPVFEQAGYQATRIDITMFSGSVDSPCGTASNEAFYCPANQQMYLNTAPQGRATSDLTWGYYLWALDHEYGHHLQLRSGIVHASMILMEGAASQDEVYQLSRRLELQANCFSGVSLHRNQAMDFDTFTALVSNVQGEEVHGTVQNQTSWAQAGWQSAQVQTCNTYLASDEQVA